MDEPVYGLGAESLQCAESPVARGRLHGVHGIDAERCMQLVNAARSQSGNLHEIEQAGRRLGAQLLEVARLARRVEVADDGERRGSDAARLGKCSRVVQCGEIIRLEGDDGLRSTLVCSHLEGTLAAELEVGRNEREHVPGGTGIHLVNKKSVVKDSTRYRAQGIGYCPSVVKDSTPYPAPRNTT